MESITKHQCARSQSATAIQSIRRFALAFCGLLAASGLMVSPAQATTVTWDSSGNVTGGNANDGTGTWSTTGTNWDNNGADSPWTNGNNAVIGNSGTAGTITVSTVSANSITFNPVTSGTYTLTGGTITLTGSGIITSNVNATINSVLASSVGLTKSGSGTLTLGGGNTYTGGLFVNQGTLTYTGGASVSGNGTVAIASGATLNLSGGGNNEIEAFGAWTIAGTLAVTNNTANSMRATSIVLNSGTMTSSGGSVATFGAFYEYLGTTITANGAGNVISGNGDFGINSVTSGGAVTFLTPLAGDSLTISTVLKDGGGQTGAATKAGAGTVVLTAADTYTAATTVNGGTLNIGGGGTTGSISSSSALKLGGGTLSNTRSNSFTQTVNGLTVNAGASAISVSAGDTVSVGAITRNVGGTVDFNGSGAVDASGTTNVNGILGGYATVGGTTWAVAPATSGGAITGLASGSYTNDTWASGNNTTVTLASNTAYNNVTTNSLQFANNAADTVTLSGTDVIATGGILVTGSVGNNLSTITGGTLEGSSGGDLVVIQNNAGGGLTIGSIIANNGAATGLTKSGTGTLTLSGADTYAGATVVNSGTLAWNGSTTLAGAATVNNGGTLSMSTPAGLSGGITVNSGGTFTWGAGTGFVDTNHLNIGTIAVQSGGVFNLINTQSVSFGTHDALFSGQVLQGAGTVNQSGGGVVDWWYSGSGASSNLSGFSGTYNVLNGIMSIQGDTAAHMTTTATVNLTAATGFLDLRSDSFGCDQLTGGGTVGASFSQADTLTVGTNNGSSIFSGLIENGGIAGGSGVISLTKAGTGTLTLTGANTYTGATTISGGTLWLGNGGSTGSISSSSAVSGVSGATLAFDETGSVTFANAISGAMGVTQAGPGTVTLSGASNSYTGGTTITSGTLIVNADGNLGGASSGITFNGAGTLQSGSTATLVSTRGIAINSGITGTFNTNGNTLTVNGVISGATGALTKTGSGNLILGGADTYGGATSINNGTIQVNNSLTNSTVTVNNGGGLGGAGTVTDAVTVNGGGAINLVNGSIGTLTLSNGLTIGSNSTPSMMDFEGNGASWDLISDPAALTVSGSTGINITALAGLTAGTYNLLTFNSLSGSVGSLYLGTTFVGGKNLSLLATGTSEELVVSGAAVYWTGTGSGNSWGTSGNWTANAAGTSGTSLATSSPTTDVYFNANGVSGPVTASLGANYDINSLNFTAGATGGTTVSDGTFGLTIEASGINVNAGSGANTINVKSVTVNASQLWANNAGSLLTVSSPVAGAAATSSTTTLTVGGSGAGGVLLSGTIGDGTAGGKLALAANDTGAPVTLTANNTYSGGTTITSGTLQVGNGGTAGTLGSGTVTDNATLVFNRSDSPTVSTAIAGSGSLVQAGSGALILTGSNTYGGGTTVSAGTLQLGDGVSSNGYVTGNITDNATLAFANPAAQTYSSTISGSGGLIKSGTGVLTLGGANTYSGNTTISQGTLIANTATALGVTTGTLTLGNASSGANAINLQAGNAIANPITLAALNTTSNGTSQTITLNAGGALGANAQDLVATVNLNGNMPLTFITGSTGGHSTAQDAQLAVTGTGIAAGNTALILTGSAQTFRITWGGTSGTIANNFTGDVVINGSVITQNTTFDGNNAANQNLGFLHNNVTVSSGASWQLVWGGETTGALNGSGSISIGNQVSLNNIGLTIGNTGVSGTYSGNISGGAGVAKVGAGTEIFSGGDTYTGNTVINAGTLQIGNGGTTGSLSSSSAISGSTGGTIAFDLSNSNTVSNTITSGVGVTQAGSGSVNLTASNSYTGATNVTAGTLIVSGSLSGTLAVNAAAATTLEVDGLVNTAATVSATGASIQGVGAIGALNLAGGATLAPGFKTTGPVAAGTLSAGNVTFTDTASKFSIALGVTSGSDSTMLASSGAVTLDNTPLQLTLGNAINNPANIGLVYVIINGGAGATGNGTDLFTSGGIAIANGASFTTAGGYTFEVLYAENAAGTGSGSDVDLELTAVPEPGTWATILLGFGMLVGLQRRRRRS